jgi:hypothetical protein
LRNFCPGFLARIFSLSSHQPLHCRQQQGALPRRAGIPAEVQVFEHEHEIGSGYGLVENVWFERAEIV